MGAQLYMAVERLRTAVSLPYFVSLSVAILVCQQPRRVRSIET